MTKKKRTRRSSLTGSIQEDFDHTATATSQGDTDSILVNAARPRAPSSMSQSSQRRQGSVHSQTHPANLNVADATPQEHDREQKSSKRDRERIRTVSQSSSSKLEPAITDLLVDQPSAAKWKNFALRAIATLFMVGSFFLIFACGPLALILMVGVLQTAVYKEVIFLAHVPSKEKKLPWFRSINWYFLLSTNYFLYGESIIHYFKSSVIVDAILLPLATHHRFISLMLYCVGFVLFVANLKKGHYKFQFQQFAWTHMTLLLVIFTSHFIIDNIFEGLFWVFIPISLVVCNDIFAYICGFFWGRTPLIKLSPKKTLEGFVGAWICTVIFGFIWSSIFMRSNYMICPVKDLAVTALSDIQCDPNPAFIPRQYELGPFLSGIVRRLFFTNIRYIHLAPVQFHVLVLSCFASLMAPFGGFFASGFKRAFKIKDFGDAIPGHGGITDRMDCQFLMGLFSAVYHTSFIRTVHPVTVGLVLEMAVEGLSGDDLIEVYRRLQGYLLDQRLLEWDALGGVPGDRIEWGIDR